MSRRIVLALVALLFAVPAWADGDFVYFKKKAVAAGGACSPSPTGDELTEGFENLSGSSNYEANTGTWTQTGSTIDNQASIASAPTNSCTKGVQYNTSAAYAYSKWDRGSPLSKDIHNIFSAEFIYTTVTIDDGTQLAILTWGSSDAQFNLSLVEFRRDGAQMTIRCNSSSSSPSTADNVTSGQWYRITVDMDAAAAAGGSTCTLDTWNGSSWTAGTPRTYTRNNGADRQYMFVGPHAAGGSGTIGAGEAMNITFGYVYMNTP